MTQLLTVNGVSKHFQQRCVLSDVSFSVLRGEVLGLIGPNGAGKTTPFECLAGLMPADAGTMKHGDKIDVGIRFRHNRASYESQGARTNTEDQGAEKSS